jgi:hypothetical protein
MAACVDLAQTETAVRTRIESIWRNFMNKHPVGVAVRLAYGTPNGVVCPYRTFGLAKVEKI